MNDVSASPEPLQGDPLKKAPDLHRGIIFQTWLGVEAWLCLKEDEYLFLEEAEDFEVVSEGEAIASQAKATKKNITLRSEDIIEAIVNFWLIRQKNPKKNINFRFITTSSIGVERTNHFGKGVSGLNVWKECADDNNLEQAKKIQTFLIEDSSIAPCLNVRDSENKALPKLTLLQFLKQATPDQVLNQLIIPMSWEAESANEDTLKEAIAIRLRAHGENHRVSPTACNRALDRLYCVVSETAKKQSNRILGRDDFRQEFEKATSQTLPNEEIAGLRAAARMNPIGVAIQDVAGMHISRLVPVQQSVPILPESTVGRSQLAEAGSEILMDQKVIVISGSSGMGKSTMANMVASSISDQWIWVDLQSVSAQSLPIVIQELSRVFMGNSEACNVCLDNLNYKASNLSAIELGLTALIRVIRSEGGKVVITTQRKLPARLIEKMGLNDSNMWNVPRFNMSEIKVFAELLGCPSDNSGLFADLVSSQTLGHPRLVHAQLAGLKYRNWPLPTSEYLTGRPREVIEELEISRQLLDEVPTSDKELLYRLSVTSGPFRKDHAIAVAQGEPSLAFPSDSFSRLVGPWIDAVGSDYYRISPLLVNAAVDNWPKERVDITRRALGRAMLAADDKTLVEANEIMKQGLLCEDEELLTGVALALLSAPPGAERSIADNLGWLVVVGRSEGVAIFKNNVFLNILLRIIQFRVATELSCNDLDDLCAIIDIEFSDLDNADDKGEGLRLVWLSTILIAKEANVAPRLLIEYWSELMDLLDNPEYVEQFSGMDVAFESIADWGDNSHHGQFLLMVIMRDMDTRSLVELAMAINKMPSSKKEIAIENFKLLDFPSRLWIDRSWIIELDKGHTNWEAVLNNFEFLKCEVEDWHNPNLNICIARAMAAISDEYLDDPDRALNFIDETEKYQNGPTYRIDDQRAMVLYRSKRYGEAVAIWKRILPEWPLVKGIPDCLPLYACERAGHAAAQDANWVQVIDFFKLGQTMANKLDEPFYEISFLADEAFAEWKSGSKSAGLDLMLRALGLLENLDELSIDSLNLHRFKKMFEQVLKWCQFELGLSREEDVWEPPIGACSRLSEDEEIFGYTEAPADLRWCFLAFIEFGLGQNRSIFNQALERANASQYAAVRFMMYGLELKVALKDNKFADLIGIAYRLNQSMIDIQAQVETEKTIHDPDAFEEQSPQIFPQFFEETIVAALVILARKGKSMDSCLVDWKASLASFPNLEAASATLSEVERVAKASVSEVMQIHQNDDELLISRRIASVRMSQDLQFSFKAMLIGQASLMDYCSQNSLSQEVGEDLAELFKKLWLFRIKLPALFVSPRLTIPPLQNVLNSDTKGLKLAASILLKARHTINLVVPNEMVASWRKIVEK